MKKHAPRTEPSEADQRADSLDRAESLGDAERLVSTAAGVVLAAAGLARPRRGTLLGTALALVGAYGIYRGVTGHCPVSRTLVHARAPQLTRGPMRTRAAITIDARPEELYGFWRDLSNLPRFMRHLTSVQVEGTRSRWELEVASQRIAWDAELIEDAPGRALAWRTLGGQPIHHEGIVRFVPAPGNRGTEVHVELVYEVPGGRMTSALAALVGASPEQQLRSDLHRLKQLVEAGEIATTRGQPAGARTTALARITTARERIETEAPRASADPDVEREVAKRTRPNGHTKHSTTGHGARSTRGES